MKLKFGTEVFNVKECGSYFSRVRGLMFRRMVDLMFVYSRDVNVDLHMMFVFYPIDVVFLDGEFRVLKVLKNVKPFLPYVKGCKCRYVLELKDCKGLNVGDKLYKLVD